MKVLILTKYSRQGASSRMRSYQYAPFLAEHGLKLKFSPLFGDTYLVKLYNGHSVFRSVILAYLRRFMILFTVFNYDRVVIEKELFPFLPAIFEKALRRMGIKYIVDYDDAIFHNYDQHRNPAVRWFLGRKIDQVMKNSAAVIGGNSYLADRAISSGATRVHIIPTVVDLPRYAFREKFEQRPVVVGWIGTQSTFKKHFSMLNDFLGIITNKLAIEIHIVGVPQQLGWSSSVKFIEWSEATEAENIRRFDIGIMPLHDSPWEKGKCSYKLIQYMASGLPVIASPVGMNQEVVKEGVTGFFAISEDDWITKLDLLVSDAPLRARMGMAGRSLVESKYSLDKTQSEMLNILRNDF